VVKSARICPHRLEAQDVALSRPKLGFESPWGHKWKKLFHRRCGAVFVLNSL
jgi:hypothetical protein